MSSLFSYLNGAEDELLEFELKEKFLQLNKEGSGTLVDSNERGLFKMKVQVPVLNETDDREYEEDRNQMEEDEDSETPLDYLLEALAEIEEDEESETPLDYLLEALAD